MLLQPIALILAALATWRVAYMITTEEGPFSLFTTLRGALDPDQRTWLGRGLNCVFCVSFWAAWPMLALALTWWGQFVVTGLALSTGAIALQTWMFRRR